MRIVVAIPAYNEEETIGDVVKSIPRNIADDVKVVVVDDGSEDGSIDAARKAGADKIVALKKNRGLARAFKQGLEEGILLKADIIVNIDADGQYLGAEVGKLIEPIKNGDADICLGSRFTGEIEYMPIQKRVGNKIATYVTRFLSGVALTDAQTGFRAFSREAALRLNTLSDYTYTQENIIQAAEKGLVIAEVPITFKKRKGESRLIHNILTYAIRSGSTILKTYRDYRPLRTFTFIGGMIFFSGFIPGARVLIHFLETGKVSPYLPSAILTSVLLILGFQIIVLGLIADMVGSNRKLLDELLYRIRRDED